MNSIFFGVIAILSLFAFFKLAKVKASSKQTNRSNRINRFGNQESSNIIEGESEFADIAAKYSEGPEKLTRGIVGPVALDKAMGQLKEVLKSSKPGELRQPIYLEKWYLLVRLESINYAKLDEQMIRRLSKDLFDEWINSKVQTQIEKLVDRLNINENILA